MSDVNIALQNFASGELSPLVRGRHELPIFLNGCEKQLNFLSEVQGPARFRTGTRFITNTRRNNVAILIPFQFNDSQSYLLELTSGYMRFYKDEGIIVHSNVTITGITQANPGVVTAVAHGYATGDEVFIDNVAGMVQLNGRSFVITVLTGNTFSIQDSDGNNINTTALTAYSSGGVAQKIVEVTTPYLEADLFELKYAQNADTMYIVHKNYEPRKLTRSSHTAWSLALFTRTADPFTDQKTISAVTLANPGVVTANAHGYATGDEIIIETIVGTTQLNSKFYTVTVLSANTFSLTYAGVAVNTSAYTAYVSGGYASKRNLLPSAFNFYEARAAYGGSDAKPETFWLSRTPTSAGVARYDDFTTGVDADHAVINTLASTNGKVDRIRWLAATDRFLAPGTFGGISKVTGSPEDQAISPTSILVRALDADGVADIVPVRLGGSIIYIHRNTLKLYSLEFDVLADSFQSLDRNLVSDHITVTGLTQAVFQKHRSEVHWATRVDGVILGLTYKSREDVTGWHRHQLAGTLPKALSLGITPVPSAYDQLWVVAQRSIGGLTRRYVEFFEDEVVIPERDDFYTGDDNEAEDDATWRRAMFEAQKQYVHMDSTLSYDGTTPGDDAGAAVTPAAVSGASVVFTASAAVFTSAMVGREIWKKAIDGVGYGRATIIGYTSSTQVTCEIEVDFNSVTAIPAGAWYLTTGSISGLNHLEGEEVKIVADGGVHPDRTVASGAVTLADQYSVVHVGLGYRGFLKTTNLEIGGFTGPSQTKPKNVSRLGLKFLYTLGARYGTSPYRMESIQFRSSADLTNRPPPLFSGDKVVPVVDNTSTEKHIYIEQIQPLPCIVQQVVIFAETDNF